MKTKIMTMMVIALGGLLFASQSMALVYTPQYAVRFGDFLAWDLPILGYDVQSSPGQLNPYVMVYTGAGGSHLDNTTAARLNGATNGDNAYESPSGTQTSYFSTSIKPQFPDPSPTFIGDVTNSWDVKLSALKGYLGASDLFFYFNNNQSHAAQAGLSAISLWAWAQVRIVDNENALPTLLFDYRNYFAADGVTEIHSYGGQNNPDVTLYTSPGLPGTTGGLGTPVEQANSFSLPGNQDSNKDYAFVPGEVCFNSGGNIVLCTDPSAVQSTKINLNLGADQAAYALFAPEINDLLKQSNFGGYDVMQVEMRLAGLENGYEQLFIKAGDSFTRVPEPATLLLLGVGLVGVGLLRKRFQ